MQSKVIHMHPHANGNSAWIPKGRAYNAPQRGHSLINIGSAVGLAFAITQFGYGFMGYYQQEHTSGDRNSILAESPSVRSQPSCPSFYEFPTKDVCYRQPVNKLPTSKHANRKAASRSLIINPKQQQQQQQQQPPLASTTVTIPKKPRFLPELCRFVVGEVAGLLLEYVSLVLCGTVALAISWTAKFISKWNRKFSAITDDSSGGNVNGNGNDSSRLRDDNRGEGRLIIDSEMRILGKCFDAVELRRDEDRIGSASTERAAAATAAAAADAAYTTVHVDSAHFETITEAIQVMAENTTCPDTKYVDFHLMVLVDLCDNSKGLSHIPNAFSDMMATNQSRVALNTVFVAAKMLDEFTREVYINLRPQRTQNLLQDVKNLELNIEFCRQYGLTSDIGSICSQLQQYTPTAIPALLETLRGLSELNYLSKKLREESQAALELSEMHYAQLAPEMVENLSELVTYMVVPVLNELRDSAFRNRCGAVAEVLKHCNTAKLCEEVNRCIEQATMVLNRATK